MCLEDDGLLRLSLDPLSGAIRTYFGRDLTSLAADGLALAWLDGVSTIAVQAEGDPLEGHLLTDGARFLDLHTGSEPTAVTGDHVTGYTYLGDGVTRIEVGGSGGFLVWR